jgi:pyridoxamine 5'-phosphate oxidase-like protein
MEPTAERLALPHGYGEATTTLAWDAVRDRLEQAPRYWLVTTHPDGRAHVVPVDGLWLDDTWFYGGSPQTLHHRNLERNPRAVVHLEDTMAAVILEGSMQRMTPPSDPARRLSAASKQKYGYVPPRPTPRASGPCVPNGRVPGAASRPTPPGSCSPDRVITAWSRDAARPTRGARPRRPS